MKRGAKYFALVLFVVIIFSLTFVSAGFFSDFFKKLTGTGKAVYLNSAEPGCDGTDSNVLLCDDFEDGDWYVTDGDNMVAANDGWFGTIYANPITPAGAIFFGIGVNPFGGCAANGG